jgi:ribonuclease E
LPLDFLEIDCRMGKQKMLINVHEDETRIALTEDGLLVGLHYQQTTRERTVGNIYKGTVVKVNPAFQAAFVDYGEKRNGFLSSSDINPSVFKGAGGDRGRPRIQSVVRAGQAVTVQVLKEGMREKGAALTTFIGLPGRYLVYTPNSERSGVSRKIEDSDKRHALRDILNSLLGEDDPGGVIIRTAGIDRPAADLKRDLAALKKEWKLIQERFAANKKPGLIHQEPGSIVRVLRDYFTEHIEEVWVDSPEAYQEALGYFKSQLPKYQKRLRLYVGDMSLFSAHSVEDQLEALGSSRVPLKSGGGIVIEPTEAMVAIDVNSGKSNQESDIEDTALRTNLEAAEEVARQLRLRNLGGLIVVDFIDMFQAKNRAKVQHALADALKRDKARTTVGTISQFGLLELSRQRIDMELSLGLRTRCPVCTGTGHIPTVQASANSVLRKIRSIAALGKYTEVRADLPLELANFLLNQKRESLRDLELEFEIHVHLFGDPALQPGQPVQIGGAGSKAAAEAEAEAPAPVAERATAEAAGESAEAGGRRRRRRRRGRGRGGVEEAEAPLAALPGSEEEQLEIIDVETGAHDRPYGVEPLEVEEEAVEAAEVEQIEDEVEEHESVRQPAAAEEAPAPPRRHREPRKRARSEPVAPTGAPGGNGRQSSATEIFASTHRVTHPEVAPPPPDERRRTSPFKATASTVASGLLFDSSQPGVTDTVPLPPPSEVQEQVGRRVLPKEFAAPADGVEPAGEYADEAPPGDAMAGAPQEGLPAQASGIDTARPARHKRRRGRGGRSKASESTAAPQEGGTRKAASERPEPGNERIPEPPLPDDDEGPQPGNTVGPEPRGARERTQGAGRPQRSRGGRGRRPRRPNGSGQAPAVVGGE